MILRKDVVVKGNMGFDFIEFDYIDIKGKSIPKTPFACKSCKEKGKNGLFRPEAFVLKNSRYFDSYNIYLKCRCSACGEVIILRLVDYEDKYENINSNIRRRKSMTIEEREEIFIKNIQRIGNTSEEQARAEAKKWTAEQQRIDKQLEQRAAERRDSYEEEERQKKSNERKQLIESGEVKYDKKNHVLYWVKTGKVYN